MDFKELDKYFNEVEKPNKEFFNKLTTSEELHYIAENHNWDNGIIILEWIVENKLCSEATALMIFWRAQPYDYTKYSYNKNIDNFNLIKTIMENFQKGFYKKTSIKYNPKNDIPEDKNIPEIMFQETNGEEPFIYYDKKDLVSLYGEYLDNVLEKCDNSMELYNIVYLLLPNILFDNHIKIFENKHCDKGIALLIFWKLHNLYNFNEEKIINKIVNNDYNEIIKYKPDDNRKGKWEVPEIMKKEIK